MSFKVWIEEGKFKPSFYFEQELLVILDNNYHPYCRIQIRSN